MYNEFGDNMSSTRKLASILFLLICAMIGYYLITNREQVSNFIVNTIKKYRSNVVNVPEKSYNHRLYIYNTVSETDDFIPHNIEDIKKIYYTVLNNGWESFTFYCPYDYESCVSDVKTIANSKGDGFITLINSYVSPYNIYVRYNTLIIGDNTINLTVEKLYSEEEIKKLDSIIDKYINENIDKNNVKQKDIEKIHDYIIKKTKYDDNYVKTDKIVDSNKATGALINGKSLCSGYADAFALFLDKLNIPNFKVNSEEHEWNVIYFNNKWSHVDVTWDDDEINKNNNRNFFLINTKELLEKDKKDHNFNKDLYLEIK